MRRRTRNPRSFWMFSSIFIKKTLLWANSSKN